MQDVELSITKSEVMNDVNKLTSYAGAKTTMADGSNAYDIVFATNDDYEMLEKFWVEGLSFITGNLRRHLKSVTQTNAGENIESLVIKLSLSDRFDITLKPSIKSSLRQYFVNSVAAKWLLLTKPADASIYDKIAEQCMLDILSKVNSKKPVQRPAMIVVPDPEPIP